MDNWIDQPLPGLEPDPADPMKRRPPDTRVRWSRWRGGRTLCQKCAEEYTGIPGSVAVVTHIRQMGDARRMYCAVHAEMEKRADAEHGLL